MANLDANILQAPTSLTGAERFVTVKDGKEVQVKSNMVLGIGSGSVDMAAADAHVVAKRLTVFSGRTAATAATIPAASGDLRELTIQNANTSSGAVTLTAPTASIYAAGSATAASTNVIAIATCATFRSDGTSWYRVTT